jgi:starch synthase
MRIALIASEAVPFSKTGGLADVAGTLYRKYCRMGIEVSLFVPLYKTTRINFSASLTDTGIALDIPLGADTKTCRVFTINENPLSKKNSCSVYFISNSEFFERDELYGTTTGDYPDNASRFSFFCRSVLETCKKLSLQFDLLHCHDWQTGLIPLYIETLYWNDPLFVNTKTMITIHNMGYQGIFPSAALGITGLSNDLFTPAGIEFYGNINFLKAGLISADLITTVSDTYAKEILTPEFGFGLDGVLMTRRDILYGVMNGIDCQEWDPATDRLLPAIYTEASLAGKKRCKHKLMVRCSFKGTADTPLLCFIGRISAQKGIALLADSMEAIVKTGTNLFILGRGDALLEQRIIDCSTKFPLNVHFEAGFDERLAHLAYAGADIFLMPSLYEPCGLGQMIAMRYGAVPLGYNTGGLADSINPAGSELSLTLSGKKSVKTDATGFLFLKYGKVAFTNELKSALSAYANKSGWKQIIQNGMKKDFSWETSARRYIELYLGAIKV